MKTDTYSISSNKEKLIFVFFSIGKKGVVTKVVVYELIDGNEFNLAFGDYDLATRNISDTVVSDNGDGKKIFSTVIGTIELFFNERPFAEIVLKGSNEVRTRLYQRIIRDYGKEFESLYLIEGFEIQNNEFETIDFSKKYAQFRIKKK